MTHSESTIQQMGQFKTLFNKEELSFVGVFGSQARGDGAPNSDIDILIDYEAPKSLFQLARIKITMEKQLGKKVDLVTRRSLKPALRATVERDLIAVYDEK